MAGKRNAAFWSTVYAESAVVYALATEVDAWIDSDQTQPADLKGIERANVDVGAWLGLTPDGSPLILRQVQGSELHAWDWIAP